MGGGVICLEVFLSSLPWEETLYSAVAPLCILSQGERAQRPRDQGRLGLGGGLPLQNLNSQTTVQTLS